MTTYKKLMVWAVLCIAVIAFIGCSNGGDEGRGGTAGSESSESTVEKASEADSKDKNAGTAASSSETAGFRIAVFVPGVAAGSPLYEMMVEGVTRAAVEAGAPEPKVVEGGFNQGEWSDGITAIAAGGDYDLIVTSNPLMPSICDAVSAQFPEQKFIVLDGYLTGNPSIHTLLYNQMEQAYLIGHLAGLITISDMSGTTDKRIAGLIAGQEYPIMNQVIRIGYQLGLSAVSRNIDLDFRVVGNWYDAAKGGQLAAGMFDQGADVILTVAGGANQGVLSEAVKTGRYVLWFDDNGYDKAPGTVAGCSVLKQERAAYEKTKAAIDGTLVYGEAVIVGAADGYVEFLQDDPLYIEHLPNSIRIRQSRAVEAVKNGSIQLIMPTL